MSNISDTRPERTMVTFLGIAGKINDFDINEVLVKEATFFF